MFPYQSINNSVIPNKKTYAITAKTNYVAPTIPLDDTIPQISEGADIGLGGSITINNAGSKVKGSIYIFGGFSVNLAFLIIAAFRGVVAGAVGSASIRETSELHTYVLEFEDTPGAAGTYTYSTRVGLSSGDITINGISGTRFFGGSAQCIMTLEEILP